MKYSRLLAGAVALLIGLPAVCQAQALLYPPSNPNVICWQPGVKLRWKDFEASGYPAGISQAWPATLAACCTAEIAVLPYRDATGKLTLLVESFFVKNKSWVRDSAGFNNKLILAHEQLHFDISELFARRIRLKVAEQYAGIRPAHEPDLYDEISFLLAGQQELNQTFDRETHQDPSVWCLRKWQALVARELAALQEYQSTACTCGQ